MFIGDDYIPDEDCESEEEEEYYYYKDIIESEKNKDLDWLYEDDDPYAEEEWKAIPGYEGLYEVSNMGRVRRILKYPNKSTFGQSTNILKPRIMEHRGGYERVYLSKNNVVKPKSVHRLVAEVFIDNPENKPCVDHFDTNPRNNKVNNLVWSTIKENANNELSKLHNSQSKMGHPSYAKPHTDETKEKIRQSHLGMKMSEESKRKMSEARKGIGQTKESIEKMLLTSHLNGKIHLQEDENGNLIYKNGIIDPRKYQD